MLFGKEKLYPTYPPKSVPIPLKSFPYRFYTKSTKKYKKRQATYKNTKRYKQIQKIKKHKEGQQSTKKYKQIPRIEEEYKQAAKRTTNTKLHKQVKKVSKSTTNTDLLWANLPIGVSYVHHILAVFERFLEGTKKHLIETLYQSYPSPFDFWLTNYKKYKQLRHKLWVTTTTNYNKLQKKYCYNNLKTDD